MDGPFELRVDCFTEQQAVERAQRAGAQLTGPRSYVTRGQSPLELF